MDKYLLEILKDVNTIIIPGLGALTITNTDTGEIMFMPYLKHDDGKLSDYIAQKEGMDENDAKNLISKYVREIQANLDKGEAYSMFQFGTFSKDDVDGDIVFKNWDKTTSPTPEQTTESKIEEPEEVVSPEPKVEEPLPSEEKPEKKTVEPVAESIEKPKEEPIKPKVEEKVEIKEEKKKVIPPVVIEKEMNIVQKEELDKNKEKLKDLKKQQEDPKKKKKRGAGFYILIVMIALIIGGGTLVGIFFDDVKQHIPFLASETTEEVNHNEIDKMKDLMGIDGDTEEIETEEEEEMGNKEPLEEEIESEEPIEEEVITPEEKVTPAEVPTNSGLSYHIVAGAFSSEDNAEKLASNLRDQGYPSTTFKRGGMTVVSLKAYATKAEANSALSETKDIAPKGWVLYWK